MLNQKEIFSVLGNDATLGIFDGIECTHANSFMIFKRRRNTATDIQITMDGIATGQDLFTSQGKNTGVSSIVVNTEHDGTNLPLIWNKAFTIP